MAVRLIEKFSESIPSWLQKPLHDFIKGKSNVVQSWKLTREYPLGTMTFQEKEIPRTKKSIEEDWSHGDMPVIHFQFPNGAEYIFILDTYYKSFPKVWKESLPWRFREREWKELKQYIAHYGIIPNDSAQKANLTNTQKDRREIKKQLDKISDPETVVSFNKAKYLKNGYASKMFNKVDAVYDELTDLFDRAIAKFDSMSEEKINECYTNMRELETIYDRTLDYLEEVVNMDVEGKDYSGRRTGEVDREFSADRNTIGDLMNRHYTYYGRGNSVQYLNKFYKQLTDTIDKFKTKFNL